jgi:adenylate kinase family enzyme
MRRVVILGTSGAGKSTLACRLSAKLGVPHVELDALHWEANWTEAPTDVRLARVRAAVSQDGWVISGNYLSLRDVVWPRADTLIWLDYPMGLVMWRVMVRSIRRCVTREPLWAGNVETWRKTFFSSDSIIVWSWTTWRKQRKSLPKAMRAKEYAKLRKFRFTSPRQAEAWLNGILVRQPPAHHSEPISGMIY